MTTRRDVLLRELEFSRSQFGGWTEEQRATYFGDTGRVNKDGLPVYDERVSEARPYHPMIRPPTIWTRSKSTHSHGKLDKRRERKECRPHDLALPHKPRDAKCLALRRFGRVKDHNHGATVVCLRCGMDWGALVGATLPHAEAVPTPWCGYACRRGCSHDLRHVPLASWEVASA